MPAADPKFVDIVALLDALVNDAATIPGSPHKVFWRNVTRDAFVAIKTSNWGVPGMLVTPGDPQASNLYLALSGKAPFDGTMVGQMPDIDAGFDGRHATPDELTMVETWIRNGAT
jgi:hypothetical protein